MKARILVVEDDPELLSLIESILARDGHAVTTAASLSDGIESLALTRPELVLADLGLPDGSGLSFTGLDTDATIVLMSADTSDDRIVDGLESGAVDFLAKPFSSEILLARIDLALRHRRSRLGIEHRIGPYSFSSEDRRLTKEGQVIPLTRKETEILRHLILKGERVDRRTLLKDVWGYSERASTHTVETHIYRLRRKIEQDPSNPRYLVTDGGGYALLVG